MYEYFKIVIIYKLIAITVEILFILHVANGFYITIQVYLHEFKYLYEYYFYDILDILTLIQI